MQRKLLVTIQGDYLGRIVNTIVKTDGTIEVITEKLHIYKAEPITNLPDKVILELIKGMKEVALEKRAALFLVVANTSYDRRTILQEDILPILNPDAEAIIVLRTRSWDRLPLEAIGVPTPEEAAEVAKWYTMFNAMKHSLLHYHRELDRLRQDFIRFVEYARRLEERNTELAKIITELQKKTTDLHTEIQSLISSIENYEKLAEVKGKEAKIWRKAYMDLKKRLNQLLDLVPTIIEYANRLGKLELAREVDTGILKRDVSVLEQKVSKLTEDLESLKEQISKLTKKEEEKAVPEEEEKIEEKKEEEEKKPEEGGEELIG